MFIIIPGELIALVTFPGVVLHEIAHRFFCDIQNIPVYRIKYFNFLSKTAGQVIHKKEDNLRRSFLIAAAPLIVNSIVCIVLTGFSMYLSHIELEFMDLPHNRNLILIQVILTWIGLSAGFNALPSATDVQGLTEKAQTKTGAFFTFLFEELITFIHIPFLGFIVNFLYMIILFVLGKKMILKFFWI